ncbi:hypothetical protein C6Q11_05135 [Burkholderia multivorans]|uniref:hypothetical protein n=1 Tax=Burkholderia multivorans TaxID=87883 RepID=UPI000D0020D1|nr:hypothetical protein [Burkholderia multivorans]PRF55306.1 hypothetical protein C6Q11_05135 [Burkholderia multivorans]
MLQKLLQLITGTDNTTLEPAYFWAAVVIAVGLGLEVYSVAAGKSFDIQAYGVGAVGMLTGLGLAKKFGS